ncbi:acyltransferase family protein, partial [Vibrio cholerae]
MKFRTDINAIRTLAVVSVVIFHFVPQWLPGGFVGVDIFFVISGYLMTRIILEGLKNQSFSLINFYNSRLNRIAPALAILCLTLLILGALYFAPHALDTLAR